MHACIATPEARLQSFRGDQDREHDTEHFAGKPRGQCDYKPLTTIASRRSRRSTSSSALIRIALVRLSGRPRRHRRAARLPHSLNEVGVTFRPHPSICDPAELYTSGTPRRFAGAGIRLTSKACEQGSSAMLKTIVVLMTLTPRLRTRWARVPPRTGSMHPWPLPGGDALIRAPPIAPDGAAVKVILDVSRRNSLE